MLRIAAMLLAGLLAAAGVSLYATADQLPARVASHFNFEGLADGTMLRSDYLLLMSFLTLAVPLLLVALHVVLPRIAPSFVRLPARDYWLAAERRSATRASIAASGLVIASVVAAFMVALNLLVVVANGRTPPRLDIALLWTLVAILVGASLACQFFLRKRFQPPQ